jgi:acyl-CoA synthetase (AMP-forming)/AMP-acid ligase II
MLAHLARTWGSKDAIVSATKRLSYVDLDAESGKICRSLLALGIGKGSRVGLMAPNSPEWVVAFMALARVGAVVVPLSTLYQAPELCWVVRHSDLNYLVVVDRYLRHDYLATLEAAFPDLLTHKTCDLRLPAAPFLRGVFVMGNGRRAWTRQWAVSLTDLEPVSPEHFSAAESEVTPADVLCVIYTSGSTAEPKAVVHTHGKLVRHGYGMAHVCSPILDSDRVATTRPFFWIAGLVATLFYCLQRGATIICPKSGGAPDILEAIVHEGLTIVVGREAWMAEVAGDPTIRQSGYALVRLAYDYSAVSVADPAAEGGVRFVNPHIEALWAARRGAPPPQRLPRHYGMTETLGTLTTEPSLCLAPDGAEWTVGHPLRGVDLRIVDIKTRQDLPLGQIGELMFRGGPLMEGMYKKERSEVFDSDGFYASGDLAEVGAQGYLFIRSRLGDMIKMKGANVAPAEVERWLMSLPGISEALVVGAPQPGTDELLLTAVVIPTPEAKLDELAIIADLKTKLSSFKVPKRILPMAAGDVPRTSSGKIVRSKLAALVAIRLRSA